MIWDKKRGLCPHRACRATPPEYLSRDEAEGAGA